MAKSKWFLRQKDKLRLNGRKLDLIYPIYYRCTRCIIPMIWFVRLSISGLSLVFPLHPYRKSLAAMALRSDLVRLDVLYAASQITNFIYYKSRIQNVNNMKLVFCDVAHKFIFLYQIFINLQWNMQQFRQIRSSIRLN